MRQAVIFSASVLFLSSTAWADFTPGNWTDVGSHHLLGEPGNVIMVYEYTGPDFTVGTFDWLGNGIAYGTSRPRETHCWITAPSGKSAGYQLSEYFLVLEFPSIGLSDYFNGTQAAGTWTFEFYESYDDWTPDPDATHLNIQFNFYDDAVPVPSFPALEKFNYGIPDDWTIVDNTVPGGGGPGNGSWQLSSEFFRDNDTGGDGACAMIDSDRYGQVIIDGELRTPLFTVPLTNATLEFDHDFNYIGDDCYEVGDVDIYTEAGGWQTLVRYELADFDGHVSLDLSAYAGQEVQIRFRYWWAYWQMWWQVDNVAIRPPSGDLNCNGEINGRDIEAFVLAILDLPAYRAAYSCELNGDFHGDGVIDELDIQGFVDTLTGI